jgi:hypothetical protein
MKHEAEWKWERVVPMLGEGGGTGKLGFAPLHHVRAYWEGLRGTDLIPHRHLIEPGGLRDALAHVFLVERIAPGLARFRLAGSHLTEVMGMEVRGMPLSAMLDPASREGARALIEAVFNDQAIVELVLESESGLARPDLRGRMILLPVGGDEGRCDRALGCLVTEGVIGRGPRRFAITRQRTEAVLPPRQPVPEPQPAFAEAPHPFIALVPGAPDARAPRTARGKPKLRLVRNNE